MNANNFQELINEWPTIKAFSVEMGMPYQRAYRWYRRNHIPSRYWTQLIAMQDRRGHEITPATLLAWASAAA